MVDHILRHFGGDDLDHRCLGAHFAAGVLLGRGVEHHEAAAMDAGGGVGDPPLHRLALG